MEMKSLTIRFKFHIMEELAQQIVLFKLQMQQLLLA
jgi:hypothetical protein